MKWLIVAGFLVCSLAYADEIQLRNGQLISNCQIIDTVGAQIRIRGTFGVKMLPLVSIEKITIAPYDPTIPTTVIFPDGLHTLLAPSRQSVDTAKSGPTLHVAHDSSSSAAIHPPSSTISRPRSEFVPYSPKDSSWALQFQISQNFSLSGFQGTTISIKRQFNPNNAIRLGLSLSLGGSSTGDTLGSLSISDHDVGLNCQWLFYLRKLDAVSFFVGFGPQVEFRGTTTENDFKLSDTSRAFDRNTLSDWGIGASGFIGVEWFFSQGFSLHAEYGLSFLYSTETQEVISSITYSSGRTYSLTDEVSVTSWRFASNGVKLGLSVFF